MERPDTAAAAAAAVSERPEHKQRNALGHVALRDAKREKTLSDLKVVHARTQTSARATTADHASTNVP